MGSDETSDSFGDTEKKVLGPTNPLSSLSFPSYLRAVCKFLFFSSTQLCIELLT